MIDDTPLTEAELDRLGEFLEGCEGGQAMTLSELDGFFAALVAGPELIMPSEYLPLVLGAELSETGNFETLEEANEILGLMMWHWNTIATTLNNGEMHVPILFEDEKGRIGGNEWAHGFMRGVSMRPEEWAELMDFDTSPGYLFPMMFLDHEHDPDPQLRPPPPAPEKREELITMMAAAPLLIYRHFKQQRQAGPNVRPTVQRRAHAKTGRNQPCPCGSGKKYKHCHGRRVQ